MTIIDCLDKLERDAHRDAKLKAALLATRSAEQPFMAFCRTCQEWGYPIYPMELITLGEEFYATMRRSTNGGGENSPKLAWEDDFYELFMAQLEERSERS